MTLQAIFSERFRIPLPTNLTPPAQIYPAPTAISHFRFRYNVNSSTDEITGRNIIYDRTNPDGTIDEVERIFDVCARGGYWIGKWGFLGCPGECCGPTILPIPPEMTSEVTNYIMMCETRLKNYKPANVNVHRCGAFLREKRLPPPPPPKPTVNSEIEQLKAQIEAQTQQINELSRKNAETSISNEQLRQDLAGLQQNLQNLLTILGNLINKA